MPQQDADASELDKAEEVDGVPLPTIGEPPVVEQPGEQALDLPAPDIAAQRSAILGRPPPAVRAMGGDQLDSSLLAEPRIERIAVVSSVANKAIGCVLEKAIVDRLFDERDFVRRSTGNPCGDRKTMAVCDCHDLGPLAALGLPDGGPPFLAPAKVPSMNASLMSMPPRS